MDVALGLLADYANVTGDGKLNILGVFQVINASNFPYTHTQMHLVLTFEANLAEAGRRKRIEVKLMSADGVPLFAVGGEMEVPKAGKFTGDPIRVNHILGFQGVRFETPGDYQFAVLVGEETKETIPLKVVQITQASPTPG